MARIFPPNSAQGVARQPIATGPNTNFAQKTAQLTVPPSGQQGVMTPITAGGVTASQQPAASGFAKSAMLAKVRAKLALLRKGGPAPMGQ